MIALGTLDCAFKVARVEIPVKNLPMIKCNPRVRTSCSTVVEHTPYDLQLVGLNLFSFLFLSQSQFCVLKQIPHVGATLLIFFLKKMLSCAVLHRSSTLCALAKNRR